MICRFSFGSIFRPPPIAEAVGVLFGNGVGSRAASPSIFSSGGGELANSSVCPGASTTGVDKTDARVEVGFGDGDTRGIEVGIGEAKTVAVVVGVGVGLGLGLEVGLGVGPTLGLGVEVGVGLGVGVNAGRLGLDVVDVGEADGDSVNASSRF